VNKEAIMASGDVVLVRSFPDEPLARRIYREDENFVLICLEDEFVKWREHGIEPFAVPCPRENIYEFDAMLFQSMRKMAYNLNGNRSELKDLLWKLAKPYYVNAYERVQYAGQDRIAIDAR
jgi:hypothetical protein